MNVRLYGILLGFVACAVGFFIWGEVRPLYITKDFSYNADLVSVDNFYDEDVGRFRGAQRSVATFSYEFLEQRDGVARIKNIFDVRTLDGSSIFSVERFYGVDVRTGSHVLGVGDKDRDGYLFAPPGLSKGQGYAYWHINYDSQAQMEYVGVEEVEGLKTYHYRSVDLTSDQTNQLTHLPGVGTERGVRLDIDLHTWIEPRTGYLVKYEDKARAVYYDLVTGEEIAPWNTFTNHYLRSSIIEHVEKARRFRSYDFGFRGLIPAFFLFIALFVWLRSRYNWQLSTVHKIRFLVLATVVVLVVGGVYWYRVGWYDFSPEFTIGILRWADNPDHEENIREFKKSLGELGYTSVRYIEPNASAADFQTHRGNVQSIALEDPDMVYSLTIPGTLIAKELLPSDVPIIFSIVTYPEEAGLIDSLRSSQNNLVGTRNWVSVREQLEYFLSIAPEVRRIGFVYRQDEPNSLIQLQDFEKLESSYGFEIVPIAARSRSDISSVLNSAVENIDAIYSACDTLLQAEQGEDDVIDFVRRHDLPDFTCNASGVSKGSMVGYVTDFGEIGRVAGQKAAHVFNGIPPELLETSTVVSPQLHINLERVNSLGLLLPQDLLSQADKLYGSL